MIKLQLTNEKRSSFLDNVGGVLILYVIFYHYIQFLHIPQYSNFFLSLLSNTFSFFMPWFFFKSGMFYRQSEELKKSIRLVTVRLFYPFLFCLLIGVLVEFYLNIYNGRDTYSLIRNFANKTLHLDLIGSVGHIWFLLSLWMVKIYLSFLNKIGISLWLVAIFAIFLAWVCYWLSYDVHFAWSFNFFSHDIYYKFPSQIGNVFLGMFCFLIGYFFKEKQYLRIVFVCSIILFMLRYFYPIQSDMRFNSTTDSFYIFYVLYGIVGCVVINNIFKRFLDWKIPVITYMGRNSMRFYLGHYLIMYVIFHTFSYQRLETLDSLPRYVVCVLLFLLIVVASDLLYRGIVRCFSIVIKK